MSVFAIGATPLWGIALVVVSLIAAAMIVSALWPPIHWRRLVAAFTFVLVAVSCVLAGWIPSIGLPMQVYVVAECRVLDRPRFLRDVQSLGDKPFQLRETALLVFPAASNEPCPTLPNVPGLEVIRLSDPIDSERAMELAKKFLDARRSRHWATWPRRLADTPRIVFAQTPGGPLTPPPSPTPLPDGRNAIIYQEPYGSVPFRSMRATVTPAAVSGDEHSRGVMIEILDARLRDAKLLKATLHVRAMETDPETGVCALDVEKHGECFPLPLDVNKIQQFDPISFNGKKLDRGKCEASLSPPGRKVRRFDLVLANLDRHPTAGLPHLEVFLLKSLRTSGCRGREAWLALDITLTVTLDTGGEIVDHRTVMLPIVSTNRLTLVTPDLDNQAAQLAAAPGWEDHDKPLGHGLDGGPGLTGLLEAVFATLTPGACKGAGCTAISDSFFEQVQGCWFKGVADAESRSPEFERCLDRTGRLAVIGIDASALERLEHGFGIDKRIDNGSAHVLVAAPAHAGTGSLPRWALLATSRPTLRTEPRIHLLSSTRDTLRMGRPGGRSGLAAQRAFVDAVPESGSMGPSRGPLVGERGDSCIPGEPFRDGGGLAWFAYSRVPKQAPDRVDVRGPPQPQQRLKGVFRYHRFTSPTSSIDRRAGSYAANVACNSPVRRLYLALTEMAKREFKPGQMDIPRAVIGIFAENDGHVDLDGLVSFERSDPSSPPCGGTHTDAAAFRALLKQYAAAGGAVLIVPVADQYGIPADARVLTAATGKKPIDLPALVRELRAIAGAPKSIHLLGAELNGSDSDADVIAAFGQFLKTRWDNDDRLAGAFIGDGALSDRQDVCAMDLVSSAGGHRIGEACAFEPGRPWATALNRVTATPEQTRRFEPTTDPFVSGRWQLCTGEEIAYSRPHGLGRVTAFGFSPFARDLFASDLSYPRPKAKPTTAEQLLRRGQCYLQQRGRSVDTAIFNYRGPFNATESLPVETRGGLKLLERFMRHSSTDRPLGTPRIQSIAVDPATGNLDVTATADLSAPWFWSPVARLSADNIPVLFTAFDHTTGLARFSVSSDDPREGLLQLQLHELPSGGAPDPVLVPVRFKGQEAAAGSAMQSGPYHEATRFALDGNAVAVLGMLAGTLMMFSPLARRWRAVEELTHTFAGTSGANEPFERTAQAAPLFSLQAALVEWGMHPGRPAAIRSFGLPAGLRHWRAGDQGNAIRAATLYPLVARNPSLPPRPPEVRLRTASEAADVLILIEGNGALLTPRPRRAPGKAFFAARFSAFLAHSVRLSHGVAEVVRIGLEPIEDLDPEDTEKAVRDALNAIPYNLPPSEALTDRSVKGRLVYYVCDGLSINSRHLVALADALVAEGSQLRIAAIVSRDDADNVGLRRDPFDGAFDDDTETPPGLIVARRDALLGAVGTEIARRQAQLVVFDSALETQGLLERMNETDFLK